MMFLLVALAGLAFAATFSMVGCTSDGDPANPGGPGTDVPGEAYVIPPFKVLLHGIELYDIWKDGEAILSVGGLGKAFFITDAGRFILPTGKNYTLYGTWLGESGPVYMVGYASNDEYAVLRYANGLKYDELLDGIERPRAVYGGKSDGLAHVIARSEIWFGPTDLGWMRQDTFADELHGVCSLTSGPTFIAGRSGIYSNETPPTWSRVYESTDFCLGIDSLDPDGIMAVETDKIIVREGEGDFEVVFVAGTPLLDVCWAAPDWAVAVGKSGAIASFHGSTWSLSQMDTPHDLRGVTAWKEDEQRFALAVGSSGSEYRYAGGEWTGGYESNARWEDLMGTGSGLPLYGIQRGNLVKYSGEVEDLPTPTDIDLSDLYCTAEDSLWVVGESNIDKFLLRYEDGTWYSTWLTSMNTISDIWVADRENVFVACDYGTVYQSVPQGGGMAPASVVQPAQHLHGIWGASAGSVYTVGDNGTISHYDGALWTEATSGTEAHLRAVWGSSDTHVVAVGDGGTVRRWNGDDWLAMDPGVDADLMMVWTDGPGNIWAAAEDGSLVHFTGGGWEAVPSGMEPADIVALWGGGDDLWIAGGSGMLLEYVDQAEIPSSLTSP
jgi:hypothetical protein